MENSAKQMDEVLANRPGVLWRIQTLRTGDLHWMLIWNAGRDRKLVHNLPTFRG
jgi:hypothetical protein